MESVLAERKNELATLLPGRDIHTVSAMRGEGITPLMDNIRFVASGRTAVLSGRSI
jgi:hypothetical protein